MDTQAQVTCSCGRQVAPKDVLQHARFLRLFSPSFVYVKYRCSHCKRVGERFIPEQDWNANVAREAPRETTRDERARFEEMGRIGPDEALDFHARIEGLSLSNLMKGLDR